MAKWIYKLELKDLWEAKEEGKISISELGKAIADRIRNSKFFKRKIHEEALIDLVLEFDDCSDDVEEFDDILAQLYDWADTPLRTTRGEMQRKMCWVNTF